MKNLVIVIVIAIVVSLFGMMGKGITANAASIENSEPVSKETAETKIIEGVGDLIEETDYAIFDNNVFKFIYEPEYFKVNEDEKCVTVSFYNEETQTAGSNTITFSEKENADAMTVAKEYAKQYGADESSVNEINFGMTGVNAYSFIVSSTDKAESGNQTRAMVCTIANGDNVIVIEVFIHVEPDEGMDMFINDKIAEVLDTFAIN